MGHATRANVTTRSRFGRGARHRTIRLREPPASGAPRLPALHRGACRGGRPPPLRTALTPSVGCHRLTPLDARDFEYVTAMGTNVKRSVTVSVKNFNPPLGAKIKNFAPAGNEPAADIIRNPIDRFARHSGAPRSGESGIRIPCAGIMDSGLLVSLGPGTTN